MIIKNDKYTRIPYGVSSNTGLSWRNCATGVNSLETMLINSYNGYVLLGPTEISTWK